MNNTINKLLLARDKFMLEIHLRQPQVTYSACGRFPKHEQRIQKFRETRDRNYIYSADLADMQLLSKYNKGIRFLLCVIDIFSKYAWVVPLKDKKGVSIVKAFQIILKQSNRKPNKIRVDKGSECYNAYFKKWL